jgi:hypothetical protein
VAAVVPANAAKARSPARAPQALVQLPERQRAAVRVAEDKPAARMTDRPKRRFERRRQRHLALLPLLVGPTIPSVEDRRNTASLL